MTGGYWYVEGRAGEHFCWAKSPSYSCPFDDGIEDTEPPPPLLVEAERIVITKLNRILRDAHRRMYGGTSQGMRDRDGDGKLTDTCRCCGAKLIRHGFAAWHEREREPDDGPRDRVAERLGLGTPTERVGEMRYFKTKKRAEAWARKQAAKGRAKAAA